MFLWSLLLLYAVLLYAHSLPDFNVSFSSKQNETGHWIAQVQLGHQQDEPWDMLVDHTIASLNGTNSSIVDARIIAPPNPEIFASGRRDYPFGLSNAEKSSVVNRVLHDKLGYKPVDRWLGFYKIHKEKINWFEARQVCEYEDAHLVVLNSNVEADVVRNLMEQSGSSADHYYWIGFHDLYRKDDYVSLFNETLQSAGFSTWGPNEPDKRPGENCGIFGKFIHNSTSKYGLGDAICMRNLPFICEENIKREQKFDQPLPLKETDLHYVAGTSFSYYKIHEEKKTWSDAEKTCSEEGAHLLVINSLQEEEAVMAIMEKYDYKTNRHWVGFNDRAEEGKFISVFNDKLESSGYANWYKGEPNGGTGENCVWYIYRSSTDHAYHDGNCDIKERFICEQEI